MKNIIFTALVFVAIASIVVFLRNEAESKQVCSDHVYAKIGERIFKLPKQRIYLSLDEHLVHIPCSSNVENPIMATWGSSNGHKVMIDEGGEAVFQITIRSYPSDQIDFLAQINADLEKQGRTLKSLPKKDGFYKYQGNVISYISEETSLKGPNGNPLVFFGCGERGESESLSCSTSFVFENTTLVQVRANQYPHAPLTVWNQVYPKLLQIVENMQVDPSKQ